MKSKYPNHHDEITLTTTNFAVSAKVASNQMLQNRCRHFYDHSTATEAEKPYQTGNFKGVSTLYNKPTAVVDEKLILVLATALSASLLFDHYVRKTFVYYSKGAGGQNTHKL